MRLAQSCVQAYLLPLLWAHCLDRQVSVDDTEHVEVLALVLMDALDLDVKEGSCGDIHASDFLHIMLACQEKLV